MMQFDENEPIGQLETKYAPLYRRVLSQPSNNSRGALLSALSPVISRGVTTYGGTGQGSPNLKSSARQLALDAIDTYDPNRSTLNNHILSNMRRLQRINAQQDQIIKVPERVVLDQQMMKKKTEELEELHGRYPSSAELADATGLSLKRIAHVRKLRQPSNTGVFMDPETQAETQPASSIPGDDRDEEQWIEFLYPELSPQDQFILDSVLGLHGNKVLEVQKIADKLGVTNGAISQRTAKLQQMIDSRLGASLL